MKERLGVIILSGGRSERMGYPKAYLTIEGVTFLEKLIAEYKNVVDEIVVVLNEELIKPEWSVIIEMMRKDCKIILNSNSEKGKLFSLQLGVRNLDCDFCFIQNVDNPLITKVILNKILNKRNLDGLTIPTFENHGGHPLLISNTVLKKIYSLENFNIHLKELYSPFSKKYVDVEEKAVLYNINTPGEYKKYVQLN